MNQQDNYPPLTPPQRGGNVVRGFLAAVALSLPIWALFFLGLWWVTR